jgi:hypothetical protein
VSSCVPGKEARERRDFLVLVASPLESNSAVSEARLWDRRVLRADVREVVFCRGLGLSVLLVAEVLDETWSAASLPLICVGSTELADAAAAAAAAASSASSSVVLSSLLAPSVSPPRGEEPRVSPSAFVVAAPSLVTVLFNEGLSSVLKETCASGERIGVAGAPVAGGPLGALAGSEAVGVTGRWVTNGSGAGGVGV